MDALIDNFEPTGKMLGVHVSDLVSGKPKSKRQDIGGGRAEECCWKGKQVGVLMVT